LDERLTRLLATIPTEVQREGLSLLSLQTSLPGRGRGNAHPGELGNAMRKLNYVRRRNWAGDTVVSEMSEQKRNSLRRCVTLVGSEFENRAALKNLAG
jgi:hypothetical protein